MGATFETTSVNDATNTIVASPDQVFLRGQLVRYQVLDGTAIGGLEDGHHYYVIPVVDAGTGATIGLQLAATSDLVALDLHPGASGPDDTHALVPAQQFTVAASGAAWLDVLGVQRVSGATTYTVTLDAIRTGGPADLLQPAIRETPGSTASGVTVKYKEVPAGESFTRFFRPDASCPSWCRVSSATGSSGSGATEVEATYDLRAIDPTTRTGALAGIVAGGTIVISRVDPDDTAPLVHVTGILDLQADTAHVDVLTNGAISLSEKSGDLRVGQITSSYGDVLLYAPGRIVDAVAAADGADVAGASITMCAGSGLVLDGTIADPTCAAGGSSRGGIGQADNFLEIDVAAGSTTGVLRAFDTTATGGHGIYLSEVTGDLPLYETRSLGDVSLNTVNGSILDRRHATPGAADDAEVYGNSVDLDANGGAIGSATNDVEIDSGRGAPATSDVALEGGTGIYVAEVDATLRLVLAQALAGDVRVRVRDSADLDEHLVVVASGSAVFAESGADHARTVAHGLGSAPNGIVTLEVGDNITTDPNSQIAAGTSIRIRGDWTNADTGHGSTIVLRGDITSPDTRVYGNADADTIQLGYGGSIAAFTLGTGATASVLGDAGTSTWAGRPGSTAARRIRCAAPPARAGATTARTSSSSRTCSR